MCFELLTCCCVYRLEATQMAYTYYEEGIVISRLLMYCTWITVCHLCQQLMILHLLLCFKCGSMTNEVLATAYCLTARNQRVIDLALAKTCFFLCGIMAFIFHFCHFRYLGVLPPSAQGYH